MTDTRLDPSEIISTIYIMRFELTEALINDILFSMEDQKGNFHLDTVEGVVVGEPDPEFELNLEDAERYIALPKWDSSEGFRLMERFTAGFKNSLIQRSLTLALNRGRGVFRAFKDALADYPEAEQRWFAFKDREMRRIILDWYNALRETWGLERIGGEPEETDDLVREDFRVREGHGNDMAAAAALHTRLQADAAPGEADGWVFPGALALVAENAAGDFAAYAAAERAGGLGDNTWRIAALEVRPEYQGLGVGEALLVNLLERLHGRCESVIVDLPMEAEGFSRVLLRESFTPRSTRYRLEFGKEANR